MSVVKFGRGKCIYSADLTNGFLKSTCQIGIVSCEPVLIIQLFVIISLLKAVLASGRPPTRPVSYLFWIKKQII
ncbi:hypothetical protein BpHYR1_035834 [Brachionus plicatilis]|uniref:Uncharacterized protein n=1 Tax=Brachionus plicatilis TaxID=10195 RepID=A0A3M7SU69_BRAPC|nr:hypothetical protein BpHYR1_035834 [Brachionus plicatilis]